LPFIFLFYITSIPVAHKYQTSPLLRLTAYIFLPRLRRVWQGKQKQTVMARASIFYKRDLGTNSKKHPSFPVSGFKN
jgi:hypothetical protein